MAPPRAGCDSDATSVASGMSFSPSTADDSKQRNPYVRDCIGFRNGNCTKTDCKFPHLSKAQNAEENKRLKEASASDSIAAVATSKATAKPKAKAKALAYPCILSNGNQWKHNLGMCGDSKINSKVTFDDSVDVDEVPVDANNRMKRVRRKVSSSTRVGRLKNHSCLPLAQGCAFNRARRLANSRFGNVYRDVIFWMEDQTMLFDSQRPMIDTEREHWQTSWGLIACWNAASHVDRDTAMHQ